MSQALENFCSFYKQLDVGSLATLKDVYTQDIAFSDLAHQLKSMASLQAYFSSLLKKLDRCEFQIEDILERDGEAYVRWIMNFRHPRLNGGAEISVSGITC